MILCSIVGQLTLFILYWNQSVRLHTLAMNARPEFSLGIGPCEFINDDVYSTGVVANEIGLMACYSLDTMPLSFPCECNKSWCLSITAIGCLKKKSCLFVDSNFLSLHVSPPKYCVSHIVPVRTHTLNIYDQDDYSSLESCTTHWSAVATNKSKQ